MYLLGPEGCRSYIQQSASETDWYTLSNGRLYMPASRYIISTYDWVCIDVLSPVFEHSNHSVFNDIQYSPDILETHSFF